MFFRFMIRKPELFRYNLKLDEAVFMFGSLTIFNGSIQKVFQRNFFLSLHFLAVQKFIQQPYFFPQEKMMRAV